VPPLVAQAGGHTAGLRCGPTVLKAFFAPETLQRRLFFVAKRFVAGETIASALRAVRELNARGFAATLDVLGEQVSSAADTQRTRATYFDLIEAIASSGVQANVSLKLSALGLHFDEAGCADALEAIAARAHDNPDGFVRIDMEGSALTQRTLDVFERVYAQQRNVGPVIQAYLKRSPADVAHLIAIGARVRLCKGAYREAPAIALHDAGEIRSTFLRLAETLLVSGKYPAIATHDPRLIEAVCAFTRLRGIGPERFEFQLLYGVRPDLQQSLVSAGYRVRIYVPFGTQWGRYFSRRVAERPENIAFALGALLGRRARPAR
jgi:proline dehydrogenase